MNGFSFINRRSNLRKTYPWYLEDGIGSSYCVAAYAPVIAANIGASYTNYANPGTYTASNPGSSPAWNGTDGWVCNADSYIVAGQSLATGYKPGYGDSVLIRFTGWNPGLIGTYEYLLGLCTSLGDLLEVKYDSKLGVRIVNLSNDYILTSASSSGVWIITPYGWYVNGALAESFTPTAGGTIKDSGLAIGAQGYFNNDILYPTTANVQAVAIYQNIDIAPYAAKLTARVNKLS